MWFRLKADLVNFKQKPTDNRQIFKVIEPEPEPQTRFRMQFGLV